MFSFFDVSYRYVFYSIEIGEIRVIVFNFKFFIGWGGVLDIVLFFVFFRMKVCVKYIFLNKFRDLLLFYIFESFLEEDIW